MVRGFNEKVFYFEAQDNVDRLMQLEIDSQNKDKIEMKEVWQLTGSRVVAFELDTENIGNDLED